MNKVSFVLIISAVILWSFICGYGLGMNIQQKTAIKEEVRIVKNISQKRAIIQSRPNADRNRILKLMYENKL